VAIALAGRPDDEERLMGVLSALGHEPIRRGRGRAVVFVDQGDAEAVLREVRRRGLECAASNAVPLLARRATDALEIDAWRKLWSRRQAAGAQASLRRRWRGGLLAATSAGLLALGVGVLAVRRADTGGQPLTATQRWYVGVMGEADAGPEVAVADRDLEIALRGAGSDAAALLVVDARGRRLAPVQWFVRASDGRLVATVAPRTFGAHDGAVYGVAIVGTRSRVEQALLREGGEPTTGDGLPQVRTLRIALGPSP
jgi:hypothetical protein